uniref:RING-type domain-containing protein n=1 Tax=Aegilops tauschii subsp. strangulata TaxID=200361 RepID=A0A453LIY9_AEGTS
EMDDSCAVCADALEWVAYGPCGHREVCSTCVVRLRFVVGDRHCCICKTDCPSVFVTKAMGDYTRVISDFSALPAAAGEGKVGEYWYHEDSRAYFDDADHYKMIRAMCRLSCSVCERIEADQAGQAAAAQAKRGDSTFETIGLLRGHLSEKHGLRMCNLCLEGRKVFICQQKLYTQEQMARHTQTGDTEVDGSEVERGGFAGHPICEYCKRAFYGDNELYAHMTRDHYSCHICQRRHPGQYDYFRNYNDLEMHFRKDHFLCEDDAHNAMEHGGRMSRAQRNAALQIPTSFMYQRNERDQRRGRGRGRDAHHDRSDRHVLHLSGSGMAVQLQNIMALEVWLIVLQGLYSHQVSIQPVLVKAYGMVACSNNCLFLLLETRIFLMLGWMVFLKKPRFLPSQSINQSMHWLLIRAQGVLRSLVMNHYSLHCLG